MRTQEPKWRVGGRLEKGTSLLQPDRLDFPPERADSPPSWAGAKDGAGSLIAGQQSLLDLGSSRSNMVDKLSLSGAGWGASGDCGGFSPPLYTDTESPFNQTSPLPLNSLPLNLSPKPRRPHEGGGRGGVQQPAGRVHPPRGKNRYGDEIQSAEVPPPSSNQNKSPVAKVESGRGSDRARRGPPPVGSSLQNGRCR